MIHFKSVRAKNILSYGNYITEIKLDESPTTLLVGQSGAGKSCITDFISFALYGKPFRPINKPELVNTVNNSECVVEIDFEIGSKKYLIRRGIKPTIFEIHCNGVLINQDSHSKDYQRHLEYNILGMNFKTFSQIVVLGSANFVPFMKLKPADRRMLIEDLLDIQIFSVMTTLLKDKISEVKSAIVSLDGDIRLQKEKIDMYKKYIHNLKKDKDKLIQDNTSKINQNRLTVIEERKELEKLELKIKALAELVQDESTLNKKISKYKLYERDIQNNLKKIFKEITFYQDNEVCPTCSREFEHEYRDKILNESIAKQTDMKAGLTKISAILSKLEEEENKITSVKSQINKVNSEVSKRNISISSIEKYVDKIEKENIELLKEHKKTTDEKTKLKELELKLIELEKDRESLSKDKLINDLAANLLKDTGIKSRIIKQYIPIINKLVNRFLSSMNFNVIFNMDENFNEVLKVRGRDNLTYFNFSDGERERLDIAILLTWRTIATMKNSVQTNLLFIDELLDAHLDPNATENILQVITNEPILKNSNIFVISHKDNIVDKFSNSIKFEKIKGFSKVIS